MENGIILIESYVHSRDGLCIIWHNDRWKLTRDGCHSTQRYCSREKFQDLRKATLDRQLFKPNLKEKLPHLPHTVDSYFKVKTCEIMRSLKDVTESILKSSDFCNIVAGLSNLFDQKRKIGEVHLKFGIDSGKPKRHTFDDSVVWKKFKCSGVKKFRKFHKWFLRIVFNSWFNFSMYLFNYFDKLLHFDSKFILFDDNFDANNEEMVWIRDQKPISVNLYTAKFLIRRMMIASDDMLINYSISPLDDLVSSILSVQIHFR